jgi:glycosyltransferase involved in cell wall biosynthesis
MLSIVTINRDHALGLTNTIASLAMQHNQTFEWVLIDGGSQDQSIVLAKAYARPCDVLSSEPDRGIYDAMNKGVARAHGDYVLFLNSGDQLMSAEAIDLLYRSIAKNLDILLYGFEVRHRKRGPKPLWSRWWSLPTSHQAILYRRALLQRYPFLEEYRLASDFEHFLRLMGDAQPRAGTEQTILIKNEPYGSDQRLDQVLQEYRCALLANGCPRVLASLIYYSKRAYLKRVLK